MRRGIGGIAAAIVGLGVVAAAGDAGADPLRIGHVTWVGFGPLYVAAEKGFFADEGLDVDLVSISDPKFQHAALAAGRIDVAMASIDGAIRTVAQGQETRYLFALNDSHGADGIVVADGILAARDLKARSVAVSVSTASEFFLKVVLEDAEIGVGDIRVVNMAAGDAGTAFLAGRVDAAVTWEPYLSRVRASRRGRVLTDTREWPGLLSDAAVANVPTIARRLADLKALYRAWVRAVAFAAEHGNEADRIMARGVGGWLEDPTEFAAVRADVSFYDNRANRAFFGTSAAPGPIVATVGRAIRLGSYQVAVDPADLIRFDIVNQ